ncbi:AraC family transcriptional regulator [Pedobacter sp.]|uniref:helix-turn-helix domain-containing protein n=1 Tax=Pedobacter sp. TaxID=1411316 RepID=UPI002B7BFBE9|nr:AraC family transcriptional regulator [Pedobacter sp.]HWW42863.1 AraC family transcriptional regulator [Pedobacter sp.]
MIMDVIIDEKNTSLLDTEYFQPEMKILNKLKNLIETDFKVNRNVNKYTDELGVTLYYLNSLTKYYFGCTVYELLQARVHQEALYLLQNSKLSIKQITFEIGTCDPSYFCRCFRKIEGVSPSDYRKRRELLIKNSSVNKFSERNERYRY